MKAMILAAGLGTRMRPLTLETPKPLLPVAGKMLIEYHIERLVRSGVREIVINHAWLGEQIVAALGDGQQYGASIRYSAEAQPLETAGGIVKALDILARDSDDNFIVVNADVFTNFDYQRLPAKLNGLAHLVLVDNPDHNLAGDFNLATNHQLLEQADDTTRRLTFSGISVLSARLFDGLSEQSGALAPLLREAIAQGLVSGEHFSGFWSDIGTPERLTEVDQCVREKQINGIN